MEQEHLRTTGIMAAACAVQRELDERDKGRSRVARELVALGDLNPGQFSNYEMNVLFQHLREQCMASNQHSEEEWRNFQWQLCRNRVDIDVLAPYDGKGGMRDIRTLFLRVWTTATGTPAYCKMSWKVFRKQLSLRGIEV